MTLTEAQWHAIASVLDSASSTRSSVKFNDILAQWSSMKLTESQEWSSAKLNEARWSSMTLNSLCFGQCELYEELSEVQWNFRWNPIKLNEAHWNSILELSEAHWSSIALNCLCFGQCELDKELSEAQWSSMRALRGAQWSSMTF